MAYKSPSTRTPGGAPPAGPDTLRRANLSLVLREHASRSRADIAQATGLHRATVSNLMAELLERRLVREVGVKHVGAIGRPGRAVALHGAQVGAVGMEINVDYIAVHGIDLSGRGLVERRLVDDAMGSGPDRAVRRVGLVAKEVAEAMRRAGAVPAGIAVAVPGLVDVTRGVVTLAPNLYWRDLPLAELLSSLLGPLSVPVRVDNDADLAALAEYTSGVAAGTPGLASGDRRMTMAVAQVGEWLGLGGSILANLFNPRVIVIGGYFASLAQWLLPHAQDQLQRLVVAAPAAQCRFVASTLGFGAASRGAASMVINHIIDDPTTIMDLPRPSPY
ncbi:ROK family protein [Sphaerisporangium sp. B11E5]|uniref:ROK family protein n=1 Tax=Sphaerisporangium sp. B11E5 TaxID=3153563 RepID=UPI00325CB5A2